GRGNPKLDRLAVAMDVLRELAAFIAEKHPKMRAQFLDAAEAFGPVLAARFGA
ncbi:MAG: DNA-binding protein, partial [Stutzerimonas stutzeri]